MILAANVPLPSPPFLGGEGLGVRGERSLGSGSTRPIGVRGGCKKWPVSDYPSPPAKNPLPPKMGREVKSHGFAALSVGSPTSQKSRNCTNSQLIRSTPLRQRSSRQTLARPRSAMTGTKVA